jgi:hypothetical protein
LNEKHSSGDIMQKHSPGDIMQKTGDIMQKTFFWKHNAKNIFLET